MNGILSRCTGRVMGDPVYRRRQQGQSHLYFTLLVFDQASTSEKIFDHVQWLTVSVWGETAEQVHDAGHLIKGRTVLLEGFIYLDEYSIRTPDGRYLPALKMDAHGINIYGKPEEASYASRA